MWKKVISLFVAIALVVVTLNYVPSRINASQSDAQSYDWSTINYVATSGDCSEYANTYKMVVAQGSATIDVIQNPGFATEKGVYVTFPDADFGDITLNDQTTTAYDKQGAGIIFHVSMFTEEYNSLVIKTSSGAVKAELYIYKKGGSSEETTTEVTEPDTGVTAPTGVKVYNFYAQEKGYQIEFTAVEGITTYNVYVDSNSEAIGTISASGDYLTAGAFSSVADGELHTVYLRSVDDQGQMSAKSSGAKVRVLTQTNSNSDPSDISRIYVVTNSGTKGGADITKANKTEASLTIIGANGVMNTVAGGGSIKRRGNSTSLADKPAYNISFNSKQSVFSNAKKGKKWCLLANAYEKTLMRNKLAMDFGAKLGSIGVPEEHYAELYIDGILQGSFVISEPAENGRSGVSYDDGDTSDEILFELEDNNKTEEGCLYYTTSATGSRFVTEDTTDTTSSRYQNWVNTIEKFDKAVVNTSSDEVFNYIDLDTFVDIYIVNTLFKTVDFGYSSVKFYITYDAEGTPTIHAGPLWDFDLSSGNSSFEENRKYDTMNPLNVNKWFNYLIQNNTFKTKVVNKFTKLQPTIQNIYKANQLGDSQITQNIALLGQSRVRNYTSKDSGGAGWSESTADGAEYSIYRYSYSTVSPYSTYTYDQHIDYLKNWLENRDKWLCTQWNIDYEEAGSADYTISSDLDITGYQISTSYGGVDGNIGFRAIYQAEPTVEGEIPTELGIIYGLVYGDSPITKDDVVYGSTSEYIESYAATDQGKLSVVMGTSQTANYYARTMEFSDSLSSDAYTAQYYIRAYAKLSDDTIVYSDVKTYTVYKVADYIYQNNLASTKSAYDYIYNKILTKVDSSYKEGDFNWGNTIVTW